MNKNILVVGGAGYIGSVTSYLLAEAGYNVVILDNFMHQQQVPLSFATVIVGDMGDRGLLEELFVTYQFSAVMHFAARIEVGESVEHPRLFYENNVTKTLVLLDAMLDAGVHKIIFSSSCAVYGAPQEQFLHEERARNPDTPYGRTKLAIEHALEDYTKAYGLQHVILRYFNAAGALPAVGLGERHEPETHVIPRLLDSICTNSPFTIFGNDYDTHDGTCVRDYVHVHDIARAHILALQYLASRGTSNNFNLGTGKGVSVQELVVMAQKVCAKKCTLIVEGRRAGDAPLLVASARKAQTILNWQPKASNLELLLKSALKFMTTT